VYEIRALEALKGEEWLRGEVPVRFVGKDELSRLAQTGDHQGVVARAAPYPYVSEAELLRSPRAVFCLDGAQDPRNIGAIARSVEAAGLAGIALPERGSPGITPVVAKASAGAVEHLEIARIANPVAFVHDAAERGRLVVGADQEHGTDYRELDWPADAVVVLGAEGAGLRPRIRRSLGAVVRIPMAGKIASLNVSVAAALIAFEIARHNS
jgi:23S rRNA (guanosine2251-2'-O)-methyltransferase